MIEPTNGPGLSGITGKSAKQGNNSLFSKLLAMLEKQTEASAKGKGVQLNAAGLTKGKATTLIADKGESLIAGKGKSLITGKGESLTADKTKAGGKTLAEETATPLISASIIIDPATQQIKKGGKTGVVNVLIGEQKTGQETGQQTAQKSDAKGQLADSALKQPLIAGGASVGGNASDAAEGEESLLLNKQPLATETKNAVSNTQTETKVAASITDAEQLLSTTDKADKSTIAKLSPQTGSEWNAPKASPNGAAVTAPVTSEQKLATPLLGKEQKVAASTQPNHASGDKPDGQQKSETANMLAGAQLQQGNKAAQPQQGQTPSASALTATAIQANSSDSSLADSGSGSSDKGGQDARNLSALNGDAKSTSASASGNSNFQSYLTGKATPTMSLFDSMKHIAQSASNGQTKLEIQLDPVNLGKIQISLQADANKQLQVHMVVDQSTTRVNIEQQLPMLRNALAQQGFDLSGFSMDSNGQQGGFADNGHQASGNNQANNDNLSANNLSANISEQSAGRTADGGLSIRV